MKWIKASERLPKDPRELVCMRGDGGGCYHYETADTEMLKQRLADDVGVHHKYDPEWLDETPDNVQDSEHEEDDELRKVINDFGIENGELKQEIQKHLDFIEKLKADINTFYSEEFEYKKEIQRLNNLITAMDEIKPMYNKLQSENKALQDRVKELEGENNRLNELLEDHRTNF